MPLLDTALPKIIKIAIAVLAALTFLAACSNSNSDTQTTAVTPPANESDDNATNVTFADVSTPLPAETPEVPPATQAPPATQLPATQPPATQPPTTQPPTTQPAATQPPATQPSTEAPVTQPPPETTATQPPTTQPPTTAPPPTTVPPPTTAPPAPEFPSAPSLALQPLYKFDSGPLSMAVHPADANSEVLYFTLRDGRVMWLKDGEAQILIDMRPEIVIQNIFNELGLTDIVFSPDGDFLYTYSATTDADDLHRFGWSAFIYEYPVEVGANGIVEITGDRRLVLLIPQPQPTHNGGDLAFGPDGMLYVSVGDGGGAGDPSESGQNPQTLLGTILRINPDTAGEGQLGQGGAYRIPPDNPFVDGNHEGIAGAPEVWLYGLRNPWRISFDSRTGDLWIADVGQNIWEEINFLPAASGAGRGANLGWNIFEGTNRFNKQGRDNNIQLSNHTMPVWEYEHGPGLCLVTGGYVYRGTELTGYDGVYIYADYCGRDIYGFQPSVAHQRIAQLPAGSNPASFGQDNSGELYVFLHDRNDETLEGWVYKLAEAS